MSARDIISHFAPLAAGYDVVLSDVWGVVHNGAAATMEACDALQRFRAGGGRVVLITNAPRPGEVVVRRTLGPLGVPPTAYDGIVSSGDVTHALIAARPGQKVLHIGPPRDLPMFDGLDAPVAALEDADYAVCSGLADDTVETPRDYHDLIERMRVRALPMICANPDIVVERGHQLVYCAGAIADLYAAAGGPVIYAGKPYRPIYEQAIAIAEAARGQPVAHGRVLAVGDSLFVTAGIHAEELGGRDDPDPAALAQMLAAAGVAPRAIMRRLVW
jgi:HAD superfamily hydrolase (TIGR01459 family)